MSILEKLRAADLFPKTLDEFRVKTTWGAAVSVVSIAIMASLFVSELSMFLSPPLRTDLVVDTNRDHQNVNIFFDVTFPQLGCSMISLDAVDVSKQHKANVEEHVTKTRIMPDGSEVDSHVASFGNAVTDEKELTAAGEKAAEEPPSDRPACGSCYGAAPPGECCNTCDQVKAAYKRRGWAFDPSGDIEQCRREISSVVKGEKGQGCRLHGYVRVKRVAGQFVIAPSSVLQHAQQSVGNVVSFTLASFNATHHIRRLQFSEFQTLRSRADTEVPLEGTARTMEEPGMFHYFLQVVPVRHKDGRLNDVSFQYSASEHFRPVNTVNRHGGLPGLYIHYDLSPIAMVVSQESRSFGHFATAVCAIVGGIFTVMGIVDKMVHATVDKYQRAKKAALL